MLGTAHSCIENVERPGIGCPVNLVNLLPDFGLGRFNACLEVFCVHIFELLHSFKGAALENEKHGEAEE